MRWATCRAAIIGAISKVDQQEAFDAGAFAVEAAAEGGGSVALQVESGKTVLRKVPLINVAGKTRHMPDDFLEPTAPSLPPSRPRLFRAAGSAEIRRRQAVRLSAPRPSIDSDRAAR